MAGFYVEITVDDVAALPFSAPGMFVLCVEMAPDEAIKPGCRYWIIRDGRRLFATVPLIAGDKIEARVCGVWGDYEHLWWPDDPTNDLA